MRYYLIAGERSGDLHGSNLVKELKKIDPQAEFRGFGGDYMQQEGVTLTVHYADMAFMGLVEILTNLNKISRYIKQCKADIVQYNPDVIILIDYAGFNRQIGKFGKKTGRKIFYYISPKVWAWYQVRALELKANVKRMFVILPFEKDFFKKYDWDVDYVGNPVLDAVKAHQPDLQFMQRNAFDPSQKLIALLPGSRKQELKSIVPLMAEVVKKFPQYRFAVATVSNLDKSLYEPLFTLPNVTPVYDHTYDLLQNAAAAIVTSGTATLETALFKVPQIVVYKANVITYWIIKLAIKVKFISLVNLIADREVIKELIQGDANPDKVSEELNAILTDTIYRNTIMAGYDEIYTTLDTGSASENTARLMFQYLKRD